ncbi:S10 family serine carboxypeptidase-like protein [Lichenibacterium minor]|nr:S8 family serine peptidase [Lichenibacterium minor]
MADDPAQPDQSLLDTTPYGAGPDASIADPQERAAVTHHSVTVNGAAIPYTARAGHLTTVDPLSAKPNASFFYVSYTADERPTAERPVTFFYNGGPGSSAVFLLLGSFAPRRIRTNLPDFTPPAPYTIEDNPDTLLDQTDLVFINPVGTGYSAAVAPKVNRDFWGVDPDAESIVGFIKRYLSAYDRWNSPKFLFGESYGTARSCVIGWKLHEDGVDLNGIVLQSSILDYSQTGNPVGLLPTLAADAWFHGRTAIVPPPPDLPAYMAEVRAFASGPYDPARRAFPKVDEAVLDALARDLGIDRNVLISWGLDVSAGNSIGLLFLTALLRDRGLAIGGYDGRATAVDTGIAATISPNAGSNDPTLTNVGGVYTAMWNQYLNDELKFTSTSPFTDLNDQTFQFWDFSHIDPTGAQKGKDADGNTVLYTAGDLAAAMALNPDLRVFQASGYYDSVTPFYQTELTLAAMPLLDTRARANLQIHTYPSGHMVYLDPGSRTAMKADLIGFYGSAVARATTNARLLAAITPFRSFIAYPPVRGPLEARDASARPWSVPELCAAYRWPKGLAGGGTIAIVELGGGWLLSDMEVFFGGLGQPLPSITDVSVDGSDNAPGGEADGEVALDIQVAAAAYYVATGQAATLRVYWAGNAPGAIAASIRRAAADGCDVCSISWGAAETVWERLETQTGTDFVANIEDAAMAATEAGMVVFAAAGDKDSSDGGGSPADVDLPAGCPSVVGCGGTRKTRGTETVWNDRPGDPAGDGTGGGFSRLFPMQDWQAGAPMGPGRLAPDVAAVADPETGYEVVVRGDRTVVGGTSAVAPLYAGLFAAFGRKLGFVTSRLWSNHLAFTDITAGDNGYFRARVGPDACTGLGVPIGDKIAALFEAPAMAEALAARADEAPAMPRGFSGRVVVEYCDGAAFSMEVG